MRFVFLIQFIFLNTSLLFAAENRGLNVGVDFDNESPTLDAFYVRGPYLVYDCTTKHWVCTGELEYNRCVVQREEAILDLTYNLPCAVFDMYHKRKDCHDAQINLTNTARFERFCLNTDMEVNKLDF